MAESRCRRGHTGKEKRRGVDSGALALGNEIGPPQARIHPEKRVGHLVLNSSGIERKRNVNGEMQKGDISRKGEGIP